MSGTLHTLPEPPLPEGWGLSAMFEGEWVRVVALRPLREGEHHDVLQVSMQPAGWWHSAFKWWFGPHGATCDGYAASLHAAIVACERAYCNAAVRST